LRVADHLPILAQQQDEHGSASGRAVCPDLDGMIITQFCNKASIQPVVFVMKKSILPAITTLHSDFKMLPIGTSKEPAEYTPN
jgi:hypothetical protein